MVKKEMFQFLREHENFMKDTSEAIAMVLISRPRHNYNNKDIIFIPDDNQSNMFSKDNIAALLPNLEKLFKVPNGIFDPCVSHLHHQEDNDDSC